jgi:pimeloyl-ACP methyl ester carboxylesterase
MNKETWFFLRGLVRESGHWSGFVEKFRAAYPRAAVVELDLPGSGIHYKEKSPLSVAAMTEFLRLEFLRHKSEKNHLFAISLGAMVGINWMQKYPEDFASAVLINTSLRGISPFHHRLRPANYSTVLSLMLSNDYDHREKKILEMCSNRPELYSKIASEWAEIQRLRPVSVKNAARQLLAAMRCRPSKEKPRAEILILSSAGDRLVHPSCSERLAKTWNLAHKIHPNAGHDLTLDEPEWVLEQLRNVYGI